MGGGNHNTISNALYAAMIGGGNNVIQDILGNNNNATIV